MPNLRDPNDSASRREAGSPIAPTAGDEQRMLEHELSAWPFPSRDEEAF